MDDDLEMENPIVISPRWGATADAPGHASPSLQSQIDAEFARIVSPYMGSNGWMCTLTIECGTIICACS